MNKLYMHLFHRRTADHLIRESIADAERLSVEHSLSAEHHQALADMYGARLQRLKAIVDPDSAPVAAGRNVSVTSLRKAAQ